MTADDFAAQAREKLAFMISNTTTYWDGDSHMLHKATLDEIVKALTALHQAALRQAETVLLDRVEKEVIGSDLEEGDGWEWAFGEESKCCPGDDFAYFGNHLKNEQRQALAAVRKGSIMKGGK